MFPKVSFVIPTFNEEKGIVQTLKSIYGQEYPKEKIEVIVVDNHSTDNTVEIVKKFPVVVLFGKIKDPEVSKMIGFQKTTGEFITYAEGDLKLRGNDWLKKMIAPLLDDQTICASFTRYYEEKSDAPITKYLTLDPLQRDALYRYFSHSPEETVVEKKNGYKLCMFEKNKIPPMGLALYRKSALWPLIKNDNKFLELDNLAILVDHGFKKFAYVEDAGYFHSHVSSLGELVKKRIRNLQKVYLPDIENRQYTWFNLNTLEGKVKVFLWVLYANSIIFPFLTGIWRLIKTHKIYALYEPLVVLFVTDMLIIEMFRNKKGRSLLSKFISV